MDQSSKPNLDQPSNRVAVVNAEGVETVLYEPQTGPDCNQEAFHLSNTPNLLALGTRNTGKSTQLRWDAILRCLMFPGFRALIIRRTIPDLRKSHLNYIDAEMKMLGGKFLHTLNEAIFPNTSKIVFTHCETAADVMNFLGSEWGLIVFDELSTFPLDMFLMISVAARATKDKPYKAVVRCGSNTLGIGSQWMKEWFIDKTVKLGAYPDYCPDDYEVQYSHYRGNKYIDAKEYEKRLMNLPDPVRRSWMNAEFVMEGAYFTDFMKKKQTGETIIPWHVIASLPTWKGEPLFDVSWIKVYRSVDWGYHPDPAVCHWHVMLPNGRKITFKERTWYRTLAADVAKEIKYESRHYHVVETFCDPTMFIKTGETAYTIADIFEQNGVPLTPAQNDREVYGYALHELLNTIIDELPSWQMVESACPELVRTLPILQMDTSNPAKIANGPDHWAISCAYFAMGQAPPSRNPEVPTIPRWMQKKVPNRVSMV